MVLFTVIMLEKVIILTIQFSIYPTRTKSGTCPRQKTCLIQVVEIRPSTRNREDYSSLCCFDRCFSSEELLEERDLIVMELKSTS
jgi:hypothetical protein